MASNPYLKRFYTTRRNLKAGLIAASLVGGAIVGAALTPLGKMLAGAPPATLSNYMINIAWFAVFGVLIGPTVIWTALRRVPLWRTVLEPLAAGIAGAAIGVALGSWLLFFGLIPVGIAAAAARLGFAYREKPETFYFSKTES